MDKKYVIEVDVTFEELMKNLDDDKLKQELADGYWKMHTIISMFGEEGASKYIESIKKRKN
jgi:hypothetical protein